MTITHVRRIDSTVQAIHTSEPDWRDALGAWLRAAGADDAQVKSAQGHFTQHIRSLDHKPWLLNTGEGIAVVPPADFVAQYEDVAATDTLDEVFAARRRQVEQGYTSAHDDVHGLGHLLTVAHSYLSGFGETPTDEFIKGQLIEAMGTLLAAVDLIDRKESKVPGLPAFYTHADFQRFEEAWMMKVVSHLDDLQDLAGQAHDAEEDSTPEEAVGWAEARFKTTFGITETVNPNKE